MVDNKRMATMLDIEDLVSNWLDYAHNNGNECAYTDDILRNIEKKIVQLNNPWTEKAEALARDIYEWCKANDFWGDNIIYFNGKAWMSDAHWGADKGKYIAEDLYEYEDRNPKDYFEYVREPYNILSMSFEGPLNHLLNGYIGHYSYEEKFEALFKKYSLYYEFGNTWNLSAYEL